MRLVLLVAAAGFASLVSTLPGPVLWAQDAEKPAIAPAPRTINLTQEQRFIIRENVKDLKLTKAQASATETIGDRVPDNIELHPMPPEIANKVPQAKSHSFFVKDGDNAIVLVSPSDRRVADVIPDSNKVGYYSRTLIFILFAVAAGLIWVTFDEQRSPACHHAEHRLRRCLLIGLFALLAYRAVSQGRPSAPLRHADYDVAS